MKRRFAAFLLAVGVLIPTLSSLSFAQVPRVRVGVVIDGPWERNDEISENTRSEIRALTAGEYDVQFPADKVIVSDWTLEGINSAIDRLLTDPQVDIVLTMGAIASGVVCKRGPLPKPVIAPFVIDARIQDIPMKNGASGVKNLSYITLPSPVSRDIKIFQEIVPFFNVTILINSLIPQTVPDLIPRIRSALQEMEIEPNVIPVERTIDSTLEALTENIEAVYIAPLFHLQPGDFDRLVTTLRERKIPSFSLIGISEVRRGIMASANPDFFDRLARRIALNLQRILLGEEPGSVPTAFATGERVIINMEVAREIGVSPPFSVMTEAVLVNEQRTEVSRTVNFASVMREAVDKNLDLAAELHFVAAGQQNVNLSRSVLLPQVNASTLGLLIDEDRAEASFGAQSQRTWSGSLSASQIIFSEAAWANFSIQKDIQRSREHDIEQLRLDITQSAATAYLNVLRGKTLERIQKENLKQTRSNLELARVREAIGYSGRSEVFRWESQIANDRISVIDAIAQRNVAEIQLNSLLHRPAEEPFATEEVDLNDPSIGASKEGLLEYYDDFLSFKLFRSFMSQEGLANSPEILALDAAISAKERELVSTRNSFWSPTIALQADVTRRFDRGGAGSSGSGLPPGAATRPDDTDWSIGLSASLPIFEGGARFSDRARASEELKDLKLTRQSAAEKIEQRVRSGLHVAGASRAAIQLSRDAAEAARKNLDLITDSYAQGILDILVLLDAQTASLNADLVAANSVHDFIIDLMEVERSTGGFYYFATEDERTDWFIRLRKFFEQARVSTGGR